MNQLNPVWLGRNLKALRAYKGLSQAAMSEIVGLARSSYAQYELGRRLPDTQVLCSIASKFGLTLESLFEPDPSNFLNKLTYCHAEHENEKELIYNFDNLSAFSKGRLLEFSQKLLELDRFRAENLSILNAKLTQY
jgi:transcriptional regulator with XRE-family HTH domain